MCNHACASGGVNSPRTVPNQRLQYLHEIVQPRRDCIMHAMRSNTQMCTSHRFVSSAVIWVICMCAHVRPYAQVQCVSTQHRMRVIVRMAGWRARGRALVGAQCKCKGHSPIYCSFWRWCAANAHIRAVYSGLCTMMCAEQRAGGAICIHHQNVYRGAYIGRNGIMWIKWIDCVCRYAAVCQHNICIWRFTMQNCRPVSGARFWIRYMNVTTGGLWCGYAELVHA